MKKIILISLLGPALVILQRMFEVIDAVNMLGWNGTYECAISMYKPCSFYAYIFNSGMSTVTYIGMIFSFIIWLAVVSYTFFLIKLYKDNNHKLFWILIASTVLLLLISPFIINYIQFIS